MVAPSGLCVSCGRSMNWCFIHGELHVRCTQCLDFFAVDVGTEVAGYGVREGREASEAGDPLFGEFV